MEPVALAAITSAVTLVATEALKGIGSEAGKQLWSEIKSILGLKKDPPPNDLAVMVAQALQENPSLASKVTKLLQSADEGIGPALVKNIDAEKVIVAQTMNIETLNM